MIALQLYRFTVDTERIKLQFLDLDVEALRDSVVVYDSYDPALPVEMQLGADLEREAVFSRDDALTIHMRSDAAGAGRGFMAAASAMKRGESSR